MVPALFTVDEVSYSYNQVIALENLSLRFNRGERVTLLGANGSGKSTLLRLLAALTFAHRGRITFDGRLLTSSAFQQAEFFYAFRRRVGIVFQNPDVQLFNASVFDEVAFGPLQLGWPRTEIRDRVTDTLQLMGVEQLRHRAPHRLSGGEKKRVALASVLITEPEVLLLDEPISALDPASQNGIIELLLSWAGSSRTVITATHDLNSLESIADRCLILQNGRLAAEADPYTVLHDLPLLERTGLLRPQRHSHHGTPVSQPHGHLHATDLKRESPASLTPEPQMKESKPPVSGTPSGTKTPTR
ncbi:MAG TPA: ABC transporter ATP-binding protein [Bryobacteraceae bacterium]|jgi:cobalt/nickel transport system ATP-binding protein|nr:ABC transporter ATP-binding protein [Bryobacteraceae bacterium]